MGDGAPTGTPEEEKKINGRASTKSKTAALEGCWEWAGGGALEGNMTWLI